MCEEKKEHIKGRSGHIFSRRWKKEAYVSRLQTLFDFSNLTKVRPLFMMSHRGLTLNRGLTLVRLRFLLTNIIIYDLSFLETDP